MRIRERIATLMTLTGMIAATSIGAEILASKPTIEKSGEQVRINFALALASDVEVSVIGADGKVVRHLAAGVLGGKTPPPEPLVAGLAQNLVWDRRDDFGKPVADGPSRIRIRAGTGVKLGRTIAGSPYLISDVKDLATDTEGNLYVLNQNFGYGTHYIQVFSADGKYLRTIMPFPANLPKESVAAFARWDEEENRPVPINMLDVYGSFFPVASGMPPEIKMIPAVTSEVGLLLCSTSVYRLDRDGGTAGRPFKLSALFGPERTYPGRKYLPSATQFLQVRMFVAVSPDGKQLYACGPCAKGKDANWPVGGLYSMKLDGKSQLEPFTTLDMPEGWEKKITGAPDPYPLQPITGLAVDAGGRIYVADRVNDQVVILDSAAKKLGAIPVPYPNWVAVHPQTGEIYVQTVEAVKAHQRKLGLRKFSGWQEPKEVARLDLGVFDSAGGSAALSVCGKRTVVWLGGILSGGFRVGRGDVTCYEDRGNSFVATVKLLEKDPAALGNLDTIAVDPANEDVYVNDDFSEMYRFNGLTGEGGNLKSVRKDFYATDLAVGPDGLLYVRSGSGYSGPFERLDRNLKPAPYASGTNLLSKYIYSRYGAGFGEKGIGVGRQGQTYITFMYDWTRYAVYGFDAAGQPLQGKHLEGKMTGANYTNGLNPAVKSAIIGPIPRTTGGVRVDSRGNIYIGVAQVPKGYQPPALYAKDRGWAAIVGSVVRFSPDGGGWIRTDASTTAIREPVDKMPPDGKAIELEAGHFAVGATKVYPGIAPYSGSIETGRTCVGKVWCDCRSARFDLDRYDRLYLPNCVDNSVSILDNAGNLVVKFGSYGNFDSQFVPPDTKDQKPLVAVPEIPLGWPIGVGVSDEHIYICDQMNRRIVRVDKTYTFETVMDVK